MDGISISVMVESAHQTGWMSDPQRPISSRAKTLISVIRKTRAHCLRLTSEMIHMKSAAPNVVEALWNNLNRSSVLLFGGTFSSYAAQADPEAHQK